jgi:Kef-type K+ transport system membrane component KefB
VSTTLQFLLAVGVLILGARLGGALSKRLNQPAVLGELLAGLLLGPTLIGFLHLPWFTDEHLGENIQHLAELGVLFLMFLAGTEINLREMARTGRAAVAAGLLGVLVPVTFGTLAALMFNYRPLEALFLGIVLSATSVSISAQTLMELGVLRRRESLTLLGAAVFDDILVILVLSVFLALTGEQSGGALDIILVLGRMLAYLVLATILGLWLIPPLLRRVERWPINHGAISLAIVLALLYAWSAEVLGGMAAITGAFLVGLAVGRSPLRQEIEHSFSALTYGFFVPLFFVSIGLEANAREVTGSGLVFGLVLIVIAIITKIAGSGLGAYWGGLKAGEALRLGIGMVSRGEVGLIVASVGLNEGLIDDGVFAGIVLVVLATTLVTPVLLRWAYARAEAPAHTAEAAGSAPRRPPAKQITRSEGE